MATLRQYPILYYVYSDWYLNIIFFPGSPLLCSTPSGTELRGNVEICPGDSGVFECHTSNTGLLSWNVNGTELLFIGASATVGGVKMTDGYIASLVQLNLTGNLTSLLLVPPANDVTVNITCDGGSPISACNRSINFLGNLVTEHMTSITGENSYSCLFYRNRRHRKASIW